MNCRLYLNLIEHLSVILFRYAEELMDTRLCIVAYASSSFFVYCFVLFVF